VEHSDLLQQLSEAIGVPGYETEVREIIRTRINEIVDHCTVDVLGNLIATRKKEDHPRVMIAAHMDEVGMMVRYIDPAGFLRLAPLGGWDPRSLPGQEVVVVSSSGEKIWGVIGVPSPHITKTAERDSVLPIDELFVDIGARSSDDVEARGIRIGAPTVPCSSFRRIGHNRVVGKALDNRAGCALLVQALERLRESDLDIELVAAFTTQEEVGQRGATVAGYRVAPDLVLAVEGPAAGDFPGVDPHRIPLTLDEGPALTIADRNLLAHRGLFDFMKRVAEENGISLQVKMPVLGSTDAGAVHRSREGVMAGVLSIPCRYAHTTRSVMSLDDFTGGLELLVAFLRGVGEWLRAKPEEEK
jgi:endoglucanase